MTNKGEEFFHILAATHIDTNCEKESLVEQTRLISQWLVYNTPSKLYRFFSSKERNIKAFEKDEIWGSRPSTFNDPYECIPCYDTDYLDASLLQALNLEKEKQFFNAVRNGYRLPQMQSAPREVIDSILSMLNDPEFENSFQANHVAFVNIITSWWKTAFGEIAQEFIEYFINAQQEQYITCFSENRDASLMWAHYADSHKGYCLEYDWSENIASKESSYHNEYNTLLAPVYYSAQRFDATSVVFNMIESKLKSTLKIDMPTYLSDSLLSIKSLLVKSVDWSYEKEWRMFQRMEKMKIIGYKLYTNQRPLILGQEWILVLQIEYMKYVNKKIFHAIK